MTMKWVAAIAGAMALAAVGCSSGSNTSASGGATGSSPSATNGSGATTTGTNGASTTTGANNTGGTVAGTSTTSGPTNTTGTNGNGTTATSGTTTSGATATTGTSGSAQSCSGIIPALGAPMQVAGSTLLPATTDGLGNALIGHWEGNQYATQHFQFFQPGQAQPLAEFTGNDQSNFVLFGGPTGFLVESLSGMNGAVLTAYSHTGQQLGSALLRNDATWYHDFWLSPAPAGGVFELEVEVADHPPGTAHLGYFDATGAQKNWVQLSNNARFKQAIGVTTNNHALALWRDGDGSMITGQWFDTTGAALSAPFTFAPPTGMATTAWFVPLNDGSLALVATDGATATFPVGVFADGSTTMTPAPAWFANYASHHFASVRGGQAYAVWPGVACSGLELVANDGTSCGCVVQGSDFSVGVDGSVFVLGNTTDWYPGLLK